VRNVTVSLEDDVARWARVQAAELDLSLSRFLGDLLREKMKQDTAYEVAMRQFLARRPKALKPAGKRYPAREQLHERSHLR